MCPQRLARIDTFLQARYIDTGKLPHAHLVVARGGQVVHRSLLGQARLATAGVQAAGVWDAANGEMIFLAGHPGGVEDVEAIDLL